MDNYIPEPFDFEILEATDIESTTLVGFNNCFSVQLSNGGCANIVNFYLETLEELLKEGVVVWPIKVSILGGKTGVINDARIPDDKYNDRFCEVCCPIDLLPVNQRLTKSRAIQCGKVSYQKCPANPKWGTPEMLIESFTICAKLE
jgi:hypothetical protein